MCRGWYEVIYLPCVACRRSVYGYSHLLMFGRASLQTLPDRSKPLTEVGHRSGGHCLGTQNLHEHIGDIRQDLCRHWTWFDIGVRRHHDGTIVVDNVLQALFQPSRRWCEV